MSEDDLAKALMKLFDEREWYIEPHYNHYGSRGVVDLVCVEDTGGAAHTTVHELKADAAISEATGANEMLRQFNRQVEYFEKGCESDIPLEDVSHVLTFKASARVLDHVLENLEMYGNENVGGRVLVREVGEPTPAIVTPEGLVHQQGTEWLTEYVDLESDRVLDITEEDL